MSSEDYDALNDAIRDAGEALLALDYGVSARVKLGDDKTWLGFGKLNRDWKLYIAYEESTQVSLAKAPLQIRVLACDKLDDLLCALKKEHKRVMALVANATDNYHEFATELTAEET